MPPAVGAVLRPPGCFYDYSSEHFPKLPLSFPSIRLFKHFPAMFFLDDRMTTF